MAAAPRRWAADLLHVWFQHLRPAQWFARDDAVDALLRRRFAPLIRPLARRPAREFLRDRLTAQAAILLFDQVPRNSFRNSPRAFATDRLARRIVHGVLSRGWLRGRPAREAQFVLMPLMHSEHVADQRANLTRFAALGNGANLRFARSHYRMVARFGHFPHRNAVLGRKSTLAERRAVAAGNAW